MADNTENAPVMEGLDFSNFSALPETDNLGDPTEEQTTTEEVKTEDEPAPENPEAAEADPEEPTPAEAPEADAVEQTEVTPETPTSESETETAAQDWKELVRNQSKAEVLSLLGDKDEILKELGISEFVINLQKHMEANGDAKKYLEVHAKDYGSMSDEEVILEGIRAEKPKAPESVIRKLYAKELAKYETDPDEDDEDAAELNDYLRKEKADEYRQKFIDEQKKLAIPEKPDTSEADRQKAEADAKVAADAEAKAKEFRQKIIDSAAAKDLVSSKILKIGDKRDYNFEVSDPQELIDMATGDKNFFSLFLNKDGELDMDHWFATAAFAKNRKLYESSLVNYGKTLANKDIIESTENPPNRAVAATSPTTVDPFLALNEAAMKRQ
ncbi:hypothetical protein GCM10027051_31220 [Niabella terrae]